jgi:hypothetical protein
MLDAVDLNENLVDVPTPEWIRTLVNQAFSDCRSKYWPKAFPPEPCGLAADINALFK